MIVTVYTDASFSQRHQAGSYAFWIVCNKGKVRRSGILKGKITSSLIAEMKCIYNAFHYLSTTPWMSEVKKVYINTDCLNAIHVISNDRPKIKKYRLNNKVAFDIANRFRSTKAIKFKGVDVTIHHVKAHVEINSPGKFVNDWCDRAAKNQIKKIYENNPNPPSNSLPR